MSPPAAAELVHPALSPAAGPLRAPERLSDRERLAILLQGAALLAHLDLAGRRLEGGWERARWGARGVLHGLRSREGRDGELPQRRLRRLGARLFGAETPPAGRGQARLAARRLWSRWRPELLPAAPDRTVGLLLESASFLFEPRFADARAALAARHLEEGRESIWVAGPGWFRRRVMGRDRGAGEIVERLRSPRAGRIWRRGFAGSGEDGPGGRPTRARRLCRHGRYRAALALLARLRGLEARVVRVRALAGLGRLAAARRLVSALEREPLDPVLELELAEAAVRVLGQAGDHERADVWVRRVLRRGVPDARARAEMLAAAAAWDRGDGEALERRLRLARTALDEPRLGWRWRRLEGLAAAGRGDGAAVERQMRRALSESRRCLTPAEAAILWNEMAIGRLLQGELAGAERALVHAVALLEGTEGSRRADLALWNLAELRLRGGRFPGVARIAEEAAARNLRRGNWRGWAHDQELRVRLLLAHGRPETACREAEAALARLRGRAPGAACRGLHGQAARALGWLGRDGEARRHLRHAGGVAGVFEPEELPAVWLHAGDRERALAETGGHPLAGLWRPLLSGGQIDASRWRRLELAGPFRCSRFVYDAERAFPGLLPLERVRSAAARLRRLGAAGLARGLDARERGAWCALGAYLRSPAPGVPEIRRLLREAGAPESRLTWRRGDEERILVGGPGGASTLSAGCGSGRLELTCREVEDPLRTILELAARDLEAHLSLADSAAGPGPRIVGSAAALRSALERADRLAPSSLPILVEGETGTGKELVARRIHAASPRRRRPLLAINCAALPEGLLQSELFGHRKGAFTGADRDRPGIFESVAGGTAFLDEIGDLPLEAQGALLRVLQESEVRRLGENRPRRVEFRLVTATHRDLAAMVRSGGFREDLLYRLRGAVVRLPPLRERGLDLLTLARCFLAELAPDRRLVLSARARQAILDHDWPGNVRELRNRLRLAAALADHEILPRHLDLPGAKGSRGLYHQRIEQVRAQLVRDALTAAEGNQAAAARRLGITRQALSYLVRKFELAREEP